MMPNLNTPIDVWFEQMRPTYERLTDIVRSTIESLLKSANIDYLSVTSRTKSISSVREKIERKGYSNPEEITDLAGIRITTYIESDVTRVCDLLKSSFRVHESRSLDKTDELGINRFGYRSVHFVCDVGSARVKLPEFAPYEDLTFEVQVRTVLQHAWAEIEHDRSYKFSGILPTPIQRRLNLLAGVLEIVDREFVVLAGEIDRYAEDVARKTQAGNLDVEINSTSILQYILHRIAEVKGIEIEPVRDVNKFEEGILELRDFGVHTLAELDNLFGRDFIEALAAIGRPQQTTAIGLLRKAMLFRDVDKYFKSAWNRHWHSFTPSTAQLVVNRYGKEKLTQLVALLGKPKPKTSPSKIRKTGQPRSHKG